MTHCGVKMTMSNINGSFFSNLLVWHRNQEIELHEIELKCTHLNTRTQPNVLCVILIIARYLWKLMIILLTGQTRMVMFLSSVVMPNFNCDVNTYTLMFIIFYVIDLIFLMVETQKPTDKNNIRWHFSQNTF